MSSSHAPPKSTSNSLNNLDVMKNMAVFFKVYQYFSFCLIIGSFCFWVNLELQRRARICQISIESHIEQIESKSIRLCLINNSIKAKYS